MMPTSHLPTGAIHSLLGGGGGVHSGHQPLHDCELVVDDLGKGRQAVGGAGSITIGSQGQQENM